MAISDDKNKEIDKKVDEQVHENHVKPRTLFSQSQLAQATGFSNATVNRYIKKHKIQGIKSTRGREILYPRDVLEKLMGYHKQQQENRKQVPQRTIVGAMQVNLKQLASQNASLQDQLKTKDEQIAKQQEINDSLVKQNEALQALLKQNQEIINKNNELVEKQNELLKQANEEPHKGNWFSRLFNK
ncbi:helix-turn-helix domain-containing protein [Lactobacillus gallinarum]|uniref:helix-turn-helix domain-containing protein n=1 Tax=Lactobacillus gallinarum TaxID=52242 RepID=UPI00195F1B04|nr:helix-turn-helix domain-containing protein [Lactobacillus gallinarum]MBM6973842.1 hypothetical protein [Lactobacillus gallinarum]